LVLRRLKLVEGTVLAVPLEQLLAVVGKQPDQLAVQSVVLAVP
jgi:hypothetical protein